MGRIFLVGSAFLPKFVAYNLLTVKVLLVNTSEQTGGAAIATQRLMNALQAQGIDAKMLVRDRATSRPDVLALPGKWKARARFLGERLTIWAHNRFSRRNLFKVSIANTGFDITAHPAFVEADVIHLHWVNQGMLSLRDIRRILASGKRVVWTLHDMWPATGICHHAYDCDRYALACHDCPFLAFPSENDLSARTFRRKLRTYGGVQPNLSVVAVSRWLAQRVQESVLLGEKPLDVIPNTLSLEKFDLLDRMESRKALGLADKRYILLFGAARIDDPIKGFSFVRQAIEVLLARGEFRADELHLLLFGSIKYPHLLDDFPITTTSMGLVNDTSLIAQLYSAANVTLSASHYETFGQTMVEAQACGCLPLSFDGSGQADIIDHKVNGYLAARLNIENLADGLEWCLGEGQCVDRRELRQHVLERYDEQLIARQYTEVYRRQLM